MRRACAAAAGPRGRPSGRGAPGAGADGAPRVSPLGEQRRCAQKVTFWKRKRYVRNPKTMFRQPVLMQEDVSSYYLRAFHWGYHYELKHWRKKFSDIQNHRVTDFEMKQMKLSIGQLHVRVRNFLLHTHKGYAWDWLEPRTYRDNPYTKTTTQWQFKGSSEDTVARSKVGRLMAAGMSKQEAERAVRERWAKHRQGKGTFRKNWDLKVTDWLMHGARSTHAQEVEAVMNRVEGKTDAGGESGSKASSGSGIPRSIRVEYSVDEDTKAPKRLTRPKRITGPRGYDPTKDCVPVETVTIEHLAGDHGVSGEAIATDTPGLSPVSGRSRLPDDFVYPIHMAMRAVV
eukprot:TRINITY_DN21866_c0_g1_i1.p1 TRINITY_DN21866_c0_g1~~TRINITY_DN21866_c0_g1_i1.p1  ORF type:complete len:373 (+),score=116.60 TRINITY_DN21866_c0_g1_i1:93-1121(+)